MQYIYYLVNFFVMFLMGYGCKYMESDIFLINHINSEIQVDGDIREKVWNDATTIINLHSPWELAEMDSTIFRCYCSLKYFNFFFKVIDKSPITVEYTNEITVAKGDRVELFFSSSSKLSPYYCIEMNPYGYILDYKAQFYRKFDYSWNFNFHSVVGNITQDGYIVEGRILLSELERVGIDFNKEFYLGVFRADFIKENEDSVIWYSWKNPKTKNPDFHIISAFGKCKLK